MDHVVSIEETTTTRSTTQLPQMNDLESSDHQQQQKTLLPLKIVCLVIGVLVLLGWIGIIVVLILQEEWQLVLVAWLLLYSAVHFCYWYCRRHTSSSFNSQIRQQLMARLTGQEFVPSAAPGRDSPPSYEDLVKSEVPPPAYYSVVEHTPRMKRFQQVQSLALPWFIKKKTLEQSAGTCSAVSVEVSTSVPCSSSQQLGESSDGWNSSVTVVRCDVPMTSIAIDNEEEGNNDTIELPSYETLMREAVQPVLTPIHLALARLPSLPPAYTEKPSEVGISQTNQQQNE